MNQRLAHARDRLWPWSGLIGAGLGWLLTQQLGSDTSFGNCAVMNPLLALFIGLCGLAITAAGGVLSYLAWRGGRADGARWFIAAVGVGAACLFAVAILLQTVASFIIPRCYG